jgi:hypothetical protein
MMASHTAASGIIISHFFNGIMRKFPLVRFILLLFVATNVIFLGG